MKKSTLLLLTTSLLFLTTCTDKTFQKVKGNWAIREFTYDGQDIMFDYLVNMIIFNEDGTCRIPAPRKGYKETAEWSIIKKDSNPYLKISSEDPVFNNEFKIKFYEKERPMVMVLSYEKTVIKCAKFLQDGI